MERTLSRAERDYRALRGTAAPLDLSGWTVLRLEGPDALPFLQGLASQDLASGNGEEASPTFFLSEKGRPIALAWVAIGPEAAGAWVLADEGARAGLRPHLERFRIMEEVGIEGPDAMPRLAGFAGPGRAELLREAAASTPGSTAIASRPISFLLSRGSLSSKFPPADPEAAEAWRVAVGLPRSGIDFDLERIATELDYPEAISLTKGCFVGQEVVARTSNRGTVRRKRAGFRFSWGGAPLSPRAELRSGQKVVGFVTSSAAEPGTGDGLGMGFAATEALENASHLVAVEGSRITPVRLTPWPL